MPLRFWKRDTSKTQARQDQGDRHRRGLLRRRKEEAPTVSGHQLAADFLATLPPLKPPTRHRVGHWRTAAERERWGADHQARAQRKRERRCQRRINEALRGGWGAEAKAMMIDTHWAEG